MTVRCDACGTTLVATAAHAGLTVACSACGGRVEVPSAPPPPPDDEPPRRTWARGERSAPRSPRSPRDPPPDPARAHSGEVPAPVASGSDAESNRALAISAVSVLLPLVGPFALWYVRGVAKRSRALGGQEPTTLRHARVLAILGTVFLGLLLLCGIPIVLVLG